MTAPLIARCIDRLPSCLWIACGKHAASHSNSFTAETRRTQRERRELARRLFSLLFSAKPPRPLRLCGELSIAFYAQPTSEVNLLMQRSIASAFSALLR
jgi:hypothetical protein